MSIVRSKSYNYSEKILMKSKMDLLINKMNVLQKLKEASYKGYPCIEFNPEGYITYIKSDFVSYLDCEKSDFEGMHFSDFIDTNSASKSITLEVWNKVLRDEIVMIDFNINTKHNKSVNVESFFEGIKNSDGIIYKIVLKISKW